MERQRTAQGLKMRKGSHLRALIYFQNGQSHAAKAAGQRLRRTAAQLALKSKQIHN